MVHLQTLMRYRRKKGDWRNFMGHGANMDRVSVTATRNFHANIQCPRYQGSRKPFAAQSEWGGTPVSRQAILITMHRNGKPARRDVAKDVPTIRMFRKADSDGPSKSHQDDNQSARPREPQESARNGMICQHATESERFVDESGQTVVLVSSARSA